MKTEWLPSGTSLLFFYDMEKQPWGFDPKDRDGWAVIAVPNGASVKRSTVAPEVGLRSSLKLRSIDSLPSWERPVIEQLNFTEEESETYIDLCDRLFDDKPKHQILGFPSPVQGDHMELEAQLASNGIHCGDAKGYESVKAKELESGAVEWRLLLQIDTDHTLGLMWGDGGILYYWVREQDARKGNFSKVWLTSQCH